MGLGPKKHTSLVFFQANDTNVSLFIVETHLYMVYPTLKAFLFRFQRKTTFGVLFGSRNRGFKAQESHQFSIFPSQLYQRILIHSGNPFIFDLPHFESFSGTFSVENDVLGPFWVPK